jgi:hypothetical protein
MKKKYELIHRETHQIIQVGETFTSAQQAAHFALIHDLHANVRISDLANVWDIDEWDREFTETWYPA